MNQAQEARALLELFIN